MSASDKLLSVLGLFTIDTPEWTVETAAKELKLGVSTTYRYFRSLSSVGLIVAYAAGRYVLGPAITQLDRQSRLHDPLINAAKPTMHEMVHRLGNGSVLLLCRLYRHQIMCIHQEYIESHELTVSYERGKLMPLHRGASSKVVLAHMPARFVRAFYHDHAQEMAAVALGASWQETKRVLRQIRTAGVSVIHAELDPGVTGIAAPLFDPDGNVIGSLGLVLPGEVHSDSVLAETADFVKSAAKTIDAAFASTAGRQGSAAF